MVHQLTMNLIKFPLEFYWSWKCWNFLAWPWPHATKYTPHFPQCIPYFVSLCCAMSRVFFPLCLFPVCFVVSSYAIFTAFLMSHPLVYVFVWQIKVLRCSISALKIGVNLSNCCSCLPTWRQTVKFVHYLQINWTLLMKEKRLQS